MPLNVPSVAPMQRHARRPAYPQIGPEPRIGRVAALIGDRARARMLAHLLSGRYATAGELARTAGVRPATASSHLAKLVSEGLVLVQPRGRHRYFRIADGDVAHALESLALVAERGGLSTRWSDPRFAPLREARRCYGHLAGRAGVALFDGLLARGCLAPHGDDLELTGEGRAWLESLGLEPPCCTSRRYAYRCIDWSERRDHLAGSLAQALLEHGLARRWLLPGAAGSRALMITAEGRRRLQLKI